MEHLDIARWIVRADAALVAVAGLVAIVFGLGFVVEDAAAQGEMFDGLGLFLGLVIVGVGLVPVAVAAACAWLVTRRPFAAAVVLSVLGALVAALGALVIGALGLAVSAPMVLGGLVVAATAFGAALVARPASVASPGGHLPR
jgi:hypothetical protein